MNGGLRLERFHLLDKKEAKLMPNRKHACVVVTVVRQQCPYFLYATSFANVKTNGCIDDKYKDDATVTKQVVIFLT